MRNKEKKQQGITLIALVVTIIVLIILAAVSIAMVIGDNGIITQAQRAAKETANSTIASEEQMNALVEEMNQYEDGWEEDDKTEITINSLKTGDYIKYNSGTNGEILCRVLYPADSEYGLQIISDKNVKTITLGASIFEEGKNSYNNAIETLNDEAERYINLTYATDARCVGSIPTIENGKFKDKDKGTQTTVTLPPPVSEGEDASTWWTPYIRPDGWGSDDTGCYNTDTNYEIDREQMRGENLWDIEESYWLASRRIRSDSSWCVFDVRCVTIEWSLDGSRLCDVTRSGTINGYFGEHGLRPCILLKSDIKINAEDGKDGSSADKAYVIE